MSAFTPPDPDRKFFDPRGEIDHVTGNLPHWRQSGVLYFSTFRTADALPADLLRRWQSEKDAWLLRHPEPWDATTRAEYIERFPRRLQDWLDAGHGECPLAETEPREIVERALRHFEGERYTTEETFVAANHVHVVLTPMSGHALSAILHSWKSFTAHAINRALGRTGEFWQQESYDHIVRSPDALQRIRNYIKNHAKPKSRG
jgi:REP element-mobilizing transposase RayT